MHVAYSYEPTKMSFYRCFNAVFSRSKNADSELVSAYLLTSVCIPILMYSLEATAPNRTTFNSLDGAVNNALRKIFNMTDQANVKCIRLAMNIIFIESVFKSLMMDR